MYCYFFPLLFSCNFLSVAFFPVTFFPTIVGFISLAANPHNVVHTQHASRISTSNDTGMSLFYTVLDLVHGGVLISTCTGVKGQCILYSDES